MDDDKEKIPDGEGPGWTDPVKDWALTGLATIFMTEDNIRKRFKELKLPKELIGTLVESATKKKGELYQVVGDEIREVLKKTDFAAELSKFLEGHKMKFEVTFEKKDAHEKKPLDN